MAFLEKIAGTDDLRRNREWTLQMKDRSLELLNKGLAACLKNVNATIVKKFEKEKCF